MNNQFFISDSHFFHFNIIRYCLRKPLPSGSLFLDVEEMNEFMIQEWNKVVGAFDIVWHHGDFALAQNLSDLQSVFNRLNGKIHLIVGNHDNHTSTIRKRLSILPFKSINDFPVLWDNRFLLSHSPIVNPKYPNVHGHLHEKLSPDLRHINVSVEQWDYKPVPIEVIEKIVKDRNL